MKTIYIRNRCSDFSSYRAARVKSLFNAETGCNFNLDADLPADETGWAIGVVVGPSGSGKSSIGREFWPGAKVTDLGEGWPQDKPIIDAIAPRRRLQCGNRRTVSGRARGCAGLAAAVPCAEQRGEVQGRAG